MTSDAVMDMHEREAAKAKRYVHPTAAESALVAERINRTVESICGRNEHAEAGGTHYSFELRCYVVRFRVAKLGCQYMVSPLRDGPLFSALAWDEMLADFERQLNTITRQLLPVDPSYPKPMATEGRVARWIRKAREAFTARHG